jgi:hypothetical protein
MAKNYTFAEAVRIINAGTDMESITDIGRRYPILMHKTATVCAKAGDAFVDLMSYMPEYLTANKVNTALKNAAGDAAEAEDTEADADESTETEATEETTEAGAQDFESMSAKQMWDMLGKAGKRKLAKSTKKADLVEACKQAFGAGATTEDEAEAETEETETEANPYDGKSAMELFKECKKRGIKAAPKKTAKFYADLLVKDDAKASAETESESDDWDEDDAKEEEPKAKKGSKKAEKAEEKKPAKKAAKKEEAADDDDDWDI